MKREQIIHALYTQKVIGNINLMELLEKAGYKDYSISAIIDRITDAILTLPLEVPSDEEIIYGVQYNPMIHESVFGCLSLHRSRKEAEIEMEFHKHQRMKEDDYSDVERWTIYEYKLK